MTTPTNSVNAKEEKNLYLQYKFTDEEALVMSKRLAELNNKVQDLEEAKKSAMSDFKSRIDISKEEMSMISRKIYSGFEMRNIECVILYHEPVWGKKLITRKDTGEQWEERMTYDENNLFNQLPEVSPNPELEPADATYPGAMEEAMQTAENEVSDQEPVEDWNSPNAAEQPTENPFEGQALQRDIFDPINEENYPVPEEEAFPENLPQEPNGLQPDTGSLNEATKKVDVSDADIVGRMKKAKKDLEEKPKEIDSF